MTVDTEPRFGRSLNVVELVMQTMLIYKYCGHVQLRRSHRGRLYHSFYFSDPEQKVDLFSRPGDLLEGFNCKMI